MSTLYHSLEITSVFKGYDSLTTHNDICQIHKNGTW